MSLQSHPDGILDLVEVQIATHFRNLSQPVMSRALPMGHKPSAPRSRCRDEATLCVDRRLYRADTLALHCHRAKAGDGSSWIALFHSFGKPPGPAQTYYRTRMASQTTGQERPIHLRWVEDSFPPRALEGGEAYFLSHTRETVECREVANMLVEAESSGSMRPNVSP